MIMQLKLVSAPGDSGGMSLPTIEGVDEDIIPMIEGADEDIIPMIEDVDEDVVPMIDGAGEDPSSITGGFRPLL